MEKKREKFITFNNKDLKKEKNGKSNQFQTILKLKII